MNMHEALLAIIPIFTLVEFFYQRAKMGKTSWVEMFWIAIVGNLGVLYILTRLV